MHVRASIPSYCPFKIRSSYFTQILFFVHSIGVTIVSPLNNTIVREGNTITITCEAIGYPGPVVWSRTNGTLSDRISVSNVSNEYGNVTRVSVNLTITNASREDTGVYTCSANNSVGSDETNITITVQCKSLFKVNVCNRKFILLVKPEVKPEIINEITDLLMNETYTHPVTFSCEAIGEPVPTINWLFNVVLINDTNKYNISEFANGTVITSVLKIQNESCIVGTYTCEAENRIDRDRKSAVLTVKCK